MDSLGQPGTSHDFTINALGRIEMTHGLLSINQFIFRQLRKINNKYIGRKVNSDLLPLMAADVVNLMSWIKNSYASAANNWLYEGTDKISSIVLVKVNGNAERFLAYYRVYLESGEVLNLEVQ